MNIYRTLFLEALLHLLYKISEWTELELEVTSIYTKVWIEMNASEVLIWIGENWS